MSNELYYDSALYRILSSGDIKIILVEGNSLASGPSDVYKYILEKYSKYIRFYKHGKARINIKKMLMKDQNLIFKLKGRSFANSAPDYYECSLRGSLGQVASGGKPS